MGLEVKDPKRNEAGGGRWATAVFAKCPRPGAVKTRLIPPLTAEQAARLQDAMLADVLERFQGACLAPTLWYAPAEERDWFAERFPATRLEPQRGPDLARRLAFFFEDALYDADSAVVVGSDQPFLGVQRILEAHARLERGADLVLGPDAGGGVYLIGLTRSRPELFLGLEMSTTTMRASLIARAETAGLRVHLLPEDLDVDTEADLVRLRSRFAAPDAPAQDSPDYPSRTAKVLEEFPAASHPNSSP